jgi:hypothetical protein
MEIFDNINYFISHQINNFFNKADDFYEQILE